MTLYMTYIKQRFDISCDEIREVYMKKMYNVNSNFCFFILTVPPVISSRGGTVTVVVNEPARLECEATGVPLPSLTWLKDGSPVASVSHGIQVPIDQFKMN